MPRQEFSKAVRRDAFFRAGGRCEACRDKLGYGQPEYHHAIEAFLGGEATLENCVVLCRECHSTRTKERHPEIDKTRRLSDKRMGIKPKRQGFRGWRKMNGEAVWR